MLAGLTFVALAPTPAQRGSNPRKIKTEPFPRVVLQSFLHQNPPSKSSIGDTSPLPSLILACSPHFQQPNVALDAQPIPWIRATFRCLSILISTGRFWRMIGVLGEPFEKKTHANLRAMSDRAQLAPPCPWSWLPQEIEANLRASQDLPPACQCLEPGLFSGDSYTSFETSIPGFQATEYSWMNANFSSPLAPEICSLPHWATQPTDLSDCLDPSSFDIGTQQQITLPPSTEHPTWSEASGTPVACHESRDSITAAVSPGQCVTNFSDSKKRTSIKEQRTDAKKRLKCPHPDCHLTFPRKYELKRHQSTIHDSKISILCSVYGCNRVSKPFPRLDKFYEHVRKHHKGPERFLCVVEACRQGPLTRAELVEHLKVQHCLRTAKQVNPHLVDSLRSLGWRLSFPTNMSPILGDLRACPLWVHGCRFRADDVSVNDYDRSLGLHLRAHDLLERSKGYEIINAAGDHPLLAWGPATCPICKTLFGDISVSNVIMHLDRHSIEERIMFAPDIAQLFRPYLTGQEEIFYWYLIDKVLEWNQDPEFRARVEEAGILSATTQTSEDNGSQPGNSMGAQGMDFQA